MARFSTEGETVTDSTASDRERVMAATGLNEVGAAFMLGRSDGDVPGAIAEFWAMERDEADQAE